MDFNRAQVDLCSNLARLESILIFYISAMSNSCYSKMFRDFEKLLKIVQSSINPTHFHLFGKGNVPALKHGDQDRQDY